ncbi:hypothetical protein U5817_10075 [Aromatoleum evansii]|uniref:Holin n=1 Tax=Aromatoleum evansii TaxID=59406 RepID=A0ABZ1ATY4_AROEV|nr:hypothetical protein U5817_09725 [Aromatoleum evansii]WRL48374.1 hypothetical protein U5817_10075 [Aromatoleum evansii]
MHLLLIVLPPSIVGVVAIFLCLAPRSGMAAEAGAGTVLTKTANTATLAAAGNAIYLGLTANELAAIGGLIVAVLSMVIGHAINVWFKYQHLQIARAKAGIPALDGGDDE